MVESGAGSLRGGGQSGKGVEIAERVQEKVKNTSRNACRQGSSLHHKPEKQSLVTNWAWPYHGLNPDPDHRLTPDPDFGLGPPLAMKGPLTQGPGQALILSPSFQTQCKVSRGSWLAQGIHSAPRFPELLPLPVRAQDFISRSRALAQKSKCSFPSGEPASELPNLPLSLDISAPGERSEEESLLVPEVFCEPVHFHQLSTKDVKAGLALVCPSPQICIKMGFSHGPIW